MNIAHKLNTLRKEVTQSSNDALRNPWVFGIIAIIVTFVMVNTVFIILAFLSSPGLVVEDYYEQGRAYEKNALKMLAATQGTRDWVTRLDMDDRVVAGRQNRIRFTAVDARGVPIAGATAKLIAYRPSDATHDLTLPMIERVTGSFEAVVAFPLKGIWDLHVNVEQAGNRYESIKRLSVIAAN